MSRVFALKNQQNYFLMNCHQNLKETLFCGFCCLIIFWMCFVILFIMGLWVFFLQWIVFSWGIEPGVWHITVCANSTMGIYESFTKWKVLLGDWMLDVFRGDFVEPYVPRELDGYGIERFSRDKERAVKHL